MSSMELFMISLVSFTIAEMMFAMGVHMTFRSLAEAARNNKGLLARAFLVNYFFIPLVTVVTIRVGHLSPMVSSGLLILAVAPAAPYGPPFTAIARGNLALSTSLMVLLAGSSAFMMPLLLHTCQPLIMHGYPGLTIDPVKLIGSLFVIQLLPLCIGLALGQWRQQVAKTFSGPASHISKLLNAAMILAIASVQFTVFRHTSPRDLLIMTLIIILSLVSGWVTGRPGKSNRISVSVVTGMRNMSLSMGVAVASFPGTLVVTTVMIYSFLAGFGVLIYAFILRKAG